MTKKREKTYYLWVLGCQMNQSDGERIANLFKEAGYQAVREAEAALIIVLACSVRQKPIDRIWGKLKLWQRINPRAKLILTGCLTGEDRKKFKTRFDQIFSIDNLAGFIKEIGLKLKEKDYLELEAEHQRKDQAFIPIMTGCNHYCSYCVVPYTRGRERSRPKEKILAEVECSVKKGFKKIILLGQNVNRYRCKEANFASLLKEIAQIPGEFKIEFLTSHPQDLTNNLIKTLADLPKFSHRLHLPVQSGDDRILKKMNRNYTANDYLKLVKRARSHVEDLTLTTDIIVGFPGETREQFQNTVDLAKKAQFDQAFIAQYSPRPGTAAEKLRDSISPKEKKRRWQILDRLINH